jgi:hypothetical protein
MSTNTTISFNTDGQQLDRVELVMFNCPEWGMEVQTIRVLTASSSSATASVFRSSILTTYFCDSLVRVCVSLNTNQAVHLQFLPFPGSNWVHLAEVMFKSRSSMCPPDTYHHCTSTHHCTTVRHHHRYHYTYTISYRYTSTTRYHYTSTISYTSTTRYHYTYTISYHYTTRYHSHQIKWYLSD